MQTDGDTHFGWGGLEPLSGKDQGMILETKADDPGIRWWLIRLHETLQRLDPLAIQGAQKTCREGHFA